VSEKTAEPDPVSACVAFVEDVTVLAVRYLSARDISFTAATTLARLARQGPARVTWLAAAEGASQPSMTQLVQRLERQGLVESVRDPDDGRVVLVSVTDAGRALLERRRRVRGERLAALLAALPAGEGEALAEAALVALPTVRTLLEEAARAEGSAGPSAH
jgi:DNA-binding MarR family transcriptional regulator